MRRITSDGVSNAKKKWDGNYVNPNREHCGNVIVPYRGRYYCRHYNHIPSSQLRQELRSPSAITRYWSLHRGKRRSLNPNMKKKGPHLRRHDEDRLHL